MGLTRRWSAAVLTLGLVVVVIAVVTARCDSGPETSPPPRAVPATTKAPRRRQVIEERQPAAPPVAAEPTGVVTHVTVVDAASGAAMSALPLEVIVRTAAGVPTVSPVTTDGLGAAVIVRGIDDDAFLRGVKGVSMLAHEPLEMPSEESMEVKALRLCEISGRVLLDGQAVLTPGARVVIAGDVRRPGEFRAPESRPGTKGWFKSSGFAALELPRGDLIDGTFSATVGIVGDVRLMAVVPGCVAAWTGVGQAECASGHATRDIHVTEATRHEFLVEDADGNPVAGARVRWYQQRFGSPSDVDPELEGILSKELRTSVSGSSNRETGTANSAHSFVVRTTSGGTATVVPTSGGTSAYVVVSAEGYHQKQLDQPQHVDGVCRVVLRRIAASAPEYRLKLGSADLLEATIWISLPIEGSNLTSVVSVLEVRDGVFTSREISTQVEYQLVVLFNDADGVAMHYRGTAAFGAGPEFDVSRLTRMR